jgi:hypothetical protein
MVFPNPVSAELARVLAEAALGFINQGEIYFVASYTRVAGQPGGPYGVIGPFPSADEAQAALDAFLLDLIEVLKGEAPSYDIFGPFDTTVHVPVLRTDQASVAEIQVTPETDAGRLAAFPIPGARYDALFYSTEAVLKFAVPYYSRVYGNDFGTELLANFQNSDLSVLAHLPWTEYALLSTTGAAKRDFVFFDRHGNAH